MLKTSSDNFEEKNYQQVKEQAVLAALLRLRRQVIAVLHTAEKRGVVYRGKVK